MQASGVTESGGWPSRLPLVMLLLFLGCFPVLGAFPFVVTVPATLLAGVVLLQLRRRPSLVRADPVWLIVLARALIVVSASISFALLAEYWEWDVVPAPLTWVLGVACLTSGVVVAFAPRVFWIHLVVQGVVLAAAAQWVVRGGDVALFVRGSGAALARGDNPYSLTFPNPYDATATAAFWAPEYIVDGRIMIGFPYLPSTLLPFVPSHLLGEVRWASVAAVLGASALLWRVATDPIGKLLAAVLPASPLALMMVVAYSVEPLILFYVVLLVWAMTRGHRRWGAVGVGLLLASKQYLIVVLPLERLVRRRIGPPALLAGVAGAAMLIAVFFALDPGGFWDSVVEVQFAQPFRADSVSLAVELVNLGLPVAPWVLSVGSLMAGLAVAFWVRVRAPHNAAWLALGIGFALLATVLLSKQAFANYYFLIYGCVLVAAVVWPREHAGQHHAERWQELPPVRAR